MFGRYHQMTMARHCSRLRLPKYELFFRMAIEKFKNRHLKYLTTSRAILGRIKLPKRCLAFNELGNGSSSEMNLLALLYDKIQRIG